MNENESNRRYPINQWSFLQMVKNCKREFKVPTDRQCKHVARCNKNEWAHVRGYFSVSGYLSKE